MTPAQKAEYRENFAAEMAIIVARKELTYDGVSVNDLDAATVAALWRALEIASKGMSKEALKRMVFGEDDADAREAAKVAEQVAEKMEDMNARGRQWIGTIAAAKMIRTAITEATKKQP